MGVEGADKMAPGGPLPPGPAQDAVLSRMGEELTEYHQQNPDTTSKIGYCTDIAHGYADRDGAVNGAWE